MESKLSWILKQTVFDVEAFVKKFDYETKESTVHDIEELTKNKRISQASSKAIQRILGQWLAVDHGTFWEDQKKAVTAKKALADAQTAIIGKTSGLVPDTLDQVGEPKQKKALYSIDVSEENDLDAPTASSSSSSSSIQGPIGTTPSRSDSSRKRKATKMSTDHTIQRPRMREPWHDLIQSALMLYEGKTVELTRLGNGASESDTEKRILYNLAISHLLKAQVQMSRPKFDKANCPDFKDAFLQTIIKPMYGSKAASEADALHVWAEIFRQGLPLDCTLSFHLGEQGSAATSLSKSLLAQVFETGATARKCDCILSIDGLEVGNFESNLLSHYREFASHASNMYGIHQYEAQGLGEEEVVSLKPENFMAVLEWEQVVLHTPSKPKQASRLLPVLSRDFLQSQRVQEDFAEEDIED
ncbi:hypothetical protein BGZ80_003428 [Entomortierella chlamydospora]|uniref:Uncharacterized protein n=1 Tax=Entomortierella chlamydospora TaxID=101097 RepID=A0A9P6MNM4_9FUNG|nr:hypothetical protein BGZ80_003428 [Entomortierella chlamydospora]